MRNTLLLLAWALSSASMTIAAAMATLRSQAEFKFNEQLQQNESMSGGVGSPNNKQQLQGRQMQTTTTTTTTEEDEGAAVVTAAEEATTTIDMPLPTTTTLAATDVGSTTESSSPEVQQQPSQTSSASSIDTSSIEYSPIYNTRMKPCTGYETEGLTGYLTLDDLRHDLQLYFYDMNGYSYHRSAADLLPTVQPSPSPSVSHQPSIPGSGVPSSIPTGRPVTSSPTDFPTSSVRIPKEPTKSPSPTMLPKFAGISSPFLNNNSNNTSSSDSLVVDIPEGALGDGIDGSTAQVVFLDGTEHPADVLEGSGISIAPIPIPSLRTGTPSKSPTLQPVEPDENQLILDQGGRRKRMRGGVVGSSTNNIDHGEEEEVGDGRWRRRLKEVADAMVTPSTIPITTMTATVASEEEFVEVMNGNGQAEVDEIVVSPDNAGDALIPITIPSMETPGEISVAESTVTDTQQQEEGQQQQQQQGGVHFHICPNTDFQMNNAFVAQLAYLPLVFESPVQQPVILACLEENTCTFTAGDFHIVFNNNGLEEDNLDQSSMDQQHSAITIKGINFEQAEESSIVMNDPRGKIIFEKCIWQNNEGEAIVIDGKYSSKNLEAEYYGVDDYMLPPGKENPFASTEPTIPAAGTTLIPDDFLFGSTVSAITTESVIGVTTTGMGGGDDDAFGGGGGDGVDGGFDVGDGFRLLQETNAVGEAGVGQAVGVEPKSLILIRNSTFTGNKGQATIAVDSFPENEGQDSGSAGSIHLELEGSTFSSERVGTSVIITSGVNVSSTGNVFEKNTANSVIQTTLGSISITDTQFKDNVVTGIDGVVVIDSESTVEDNNCAEEPTQTDEEGETSMASLSSRQGDLSARICEGTVVAMGGICLPFGICDPADIEEEVVESNVTNIEEEVVESNVTEPIDKAQPEPMTDCHDNWTDLKYAVENRVMDGIVVLSHIGSLDFKVCPNATLDASSGPIVIDYDYVTVQCGNNGLKTDNCQIVGGFVHFHIVGSATDIKLAGLRMSSSKGSSIIAAGSKDATLHISGCEWMANNGASAILIRNNATADAGNTTGILDISSMLNTSEAAMSVEMSGVGFMQNVLTYGTVVNVGGSLTIDKARFDGNEIDVGDVVVMKSGELFIRESCFDDSASMMPGTIFIDDTSFLQENRNTFGFDNTDGGFDNGLSCTDIFVVAVGSDCSTGSNCDGKCTNFTSKTCPLDVTTPGGTNETDTSSPEYVRSKNPSDSASIVPIIVAVLVCAFIVFGLGFIVFKRRRKTPASGGSFQGVEVDDTI